jgi:hypothetical protein
MCEKNCQNQISRPFFVTKLMHKVYRGKNRQTPQFVYFCNLKTLLKQNNHPKSENSPNLVTMLTMYKSRWATTQAAF